MNKGKRILYITVLVLVVATVSSVVVGLKGCYSTTLTRTFFAADTVCTMTLYDGDEAALDGAVDLVNKLSAVLDCKDETSELGRLNKTGVSDTPSTELLEVLTAALTYCEQSKGVFDITVKPFSDLWDFKNQTVPDTAALAAALSKVGYQNLSIQNNTIVLKNGAQIDLGAIAKGYIADQVVAFLTKAGVTSGIVNLGGNVSVIGGKNGADFSVGIQKPFSDTLAASISCRDLSVVTSGTYQRYFEADGTRYHHLLNTKTGMPMENGLTSVTILSQNATDADALSTLCFLLGKEDGMALIEQTPDTEAVFIDEKNTLHLTNGLSMDANGNIIYK